MVYAKAEHPGRQKNIYVLLWEIFFEQCENDLVRGQLHRRLMDENFEGLRPDLTRGEMLLGEDGY